MQFLAGMNRGLPGGERTASVHANRVLIIAKRRSSVNFEARPPSRTSAQSTAVRLTKHARIEAFRSTSETLDSGTAPTSEMRSQ